MPVSKSSNKSYSLEALIIENRELLNQYTNIRTRYDLFTKSSGDGYWEWDLVNSTLMTSDRWKNTLGIEDLNKQLILSDWSDRIHPDDIERVLADLNEHLDGKIPFYSSEYRIRHEDGSYIFVHDSGQASFSDSGAPELVIGSCTNITEKLNKSTQLAKSENTLNTILSCMSEGILVIDKQGQFIYANDNFSKLVGLSIDQVKGTSPTDPRYRVIHQDGSDYPGDQHPSSITIKTGKPVKNDIQGIIFNDTTNWVSVNTTPMFKSDSDEMIGAVITFTDITEQIKKEEHIKKLAFLDYLTGLPNRNSLESKLESLIEHQDKSSSAILMLDIDRFKLINDSKGHIVGDELLKIIAKRFDATKRDSDFIARVGGDEFIAIIPDVDKVTATLIAQRFLDTLDHSINIKDCSFNVSASIGICMLPEDGNTIESLMMKSDIAMYHAKSSGRSCIRTYNSQLSNNLNERHEIRNALMKAIDNNELDIHYQPQINCLTNKMVGSEALLRWYHPNIGHISPAKFIPIAEDSGSIIPIGKWLIAQVCATIHKLGEQHQGLPIAINLSSKQFSDPTLLQFISDVLEQNQLSCKAISFELTESILINQNSVTKASIDGLHAMGIGLSIDDFGTGYSSLSYLKHLPIQCLKIDKSFVDNIVTSKTDMGIAKVIIELANMMSISILAEGVEEQEQADLLKELGCPLIQGYLYSKPIPIDAYKVFLKQHK